MPLFCSSTPLNSSLIMSKYQWFAVWYRNSPNHCLIKILLVGSYELLPVKRDIHQEPICFYVDVLPHTTSRGFRRFLRTSNDYLLLSNWKVFNLVTIRQASQGQHHHLWLSPNLKPLCRWTALALIDCHLCHGFSLSADCCDSFLWWATSASAEQMDVSAFDDNSFGCTIAAAATKKNVLRIKILLLLLEIILCKDHVPTYIPTSRWKVRGPWRPKPSP